MGSDDAMAATVRSAQAVTLEPATYPGQLRGISGLTVAAATVPLVDSSVPESAVCEALRAAVLSGERRILQLILLLQEHDIPVPRQEAIESS